MNKINSVKWPISFTERMGQVLIHEDGSTVVCDGVNSQTQAKCDRGAIIMCNSCKRGFCSCHMLIMVGKCRACAPEQYDAL